MKEIFKKLIVDFHERIFPHIALGTSQKQIYPSHLSFCPYLNSLNRRIESLYSS